MMGLYVNIIDQERSETLQENQNAWEKEAMWITLRVKRDYVTKIGLIMAKRYLIDSPRLYAATLSSLALTLPSCQPPPNQHGWNLDNNPRSFHYDSFIFCWADVKDDNTHVFSR